MTIFPTDCSPYKDHLKAYADGELSWLRRRAVRRHLTHCASCQEEIFHMTQIAEDLRTTEPAETLPPSLREKILEAPGTDAASVAERISLNSRPARSVPGKSRRLPAWAFAAVALVAWFLLFPIYTRSMLHVTNQNRIITSETTRQEPRLSAPQIPLPASVNGTVPSAQSPPAASASRVTGSPFENANGIYPSPSDASQSAQTYDRNGPAAPASAIPPPEPPITVRLSDREAGTSDGNVYLRIKDPNSVYQDKAGNPRVVYSASGLENLNNGALNATSATSNSNALNADPESLRQVHKEASIGIQVPNPETTGDTLNTMVQETGGYVAANNLSTGGDGLKSAELIVKVPVTQFETFLSQIAKLGSVQSKNISGEDITEKTSDADQTESVLEDDLQQSETRLKVLGSKAKWHDQVATRDLRIQLAQSRARLVLLKRMAALGTITIDLSQTPKTAVTPPVTGGFLNTLKATTHDALQSLVGSAGALLALVIWLLAYAPIWVPLLLIGRYALKEYRKREAA